LAIVQEIEKNSSIYIFSGKKAKKEKKWTCPNTAGRFGTVMRTTELNVLKILIKKKLKYTLNF